MSTITVAGYELAGDRRYDPDSNLWVAPGAGARRVRIGLDPLGSEIMGDIVAVSFAEVGAGLRRGDAFATLEAAKFVGPLLAPVAGRLAAVNEAAVADPGSLNSDPLGTWLIELEEVQDAELAGLLCDPEEIARWFEQALDRYRREGAIAER
jgi:glycine cleavage system H protein